MRDAAKDLCDFKDDPNVDGGNWNRWINDGIEKIYRIAYKRNAGAFRTFVDFTLSAASNLFPKPANFRRLIGVSLDPTSASMRRSLRKLMVGERDSAGLYGPRRYDLVGQNIAIEPFQLCAGNYRLHYVVGPTVLVSDSDAIDAILEPYDDYATTWAATKALGKEESDNRDLYRELDMLEKDIDEMFAMMDGDDASTIVDDDNRGPAIYSVP